MEDIDLFNGYISFFLQPHVPTLPMYLLESIFINFIITYYICHQATLEIEVVQ